MIWIEAGNARERVGATSQSGQGDPVVGSAYCVLTPKATQHWGRNRCVCWAWRKNSYVCLMPQQIRFSCVKVLMKDIVTPVPQEEVKTVIRKCLEQAALVNYTRLSEYAKIEGKALSL